jgi:hypothetical protein
MQDFANLLQSYDLRALVDEIASADPPAFLHRCFAEGLAAPRLSHAHVQELAGCAIVLDALLNERAYAALEPELIADCASITARPGRRSTRRPSRPYIAPRSKIRA